MRLRVQEPHAGWFLLLPPGSSGDNPRGIGERGRAREPAWPGASALTSSLPFLSLGSPRRACFSALEGLICSFTSIWCVPPRSQVLFQEYISEERKPYQGLWPGRLCSGGWRGSAHRQRAAVSWTVATVGTEVGWSC